MHLVEIINKITTKQIGTFIVCDDHLAELKEKHDPGICMVKVLTSGFEAECQMCAGETTPVTFDKTPEKIELHLTYENGHAEGGWTASGQIGDLDYIMANDGKLYNTLEALYREGVRQIYIEAGFELNLEELELKGV